MIRKNICCECNMLRGTAMAIAVRWSLTTLTIPYFKNFHTNQNILAMILTKKFSLICETVFDIQAKWKNLVKTT